ncbi:MAG: ZIP family metal transporter [Syntrophomonas sp.]
MSNLFLVSFIAGSCTVLGAMMLFVKKRWSPRSLAFFLGLASGVMIAVICFDMLPSAFISNWKGTFEGIALGLFCLWACDRLFFKHLSTEDSVLGLGYLIMLGIAMHDLPEGMAIAMGGEMKARTGMLIALAISLHNIPEGMVIAAPLIAGGMRRSAIALRLLAIAFITPLGTVAGKLLVSILPGLLGVMLGFASGVMAYLVVFHLWPQGAKKGNRSRWLGFWTGVLIILAATFI